MDITGLKAAALDQAGDAVVVIDREGIIRAWNAAAEKLFVWKADEVIGEDVKVFIPERLRSSHDRGFFAAMEAGHLHSDGKPRHTKALAPDGSSIYVTMSFAVVLDDGGTAVGAVAMAREWVREERPTA